MSKKSSERTSWPEVVGMPVKEAEDKIRQDYKNIMIQVLPENSMVTMDYREDRVRIFINEDKKVVNPPMIG